MRPSRRKVLVSVRAALALLALLGGGLGAWFLLADDPRPRLGVGPAASARAPRATAPAQLESEALPFDSGGDEQRSSPLAQAERWVSVFAAEDGRPLHDARIPVSGRRGR